MKKFFTSKFQKICSIAAFVGSFLFLVSTQLAFAQSTVGGVVGGAALASTGLVGSAINLVTTGNGAIINNFSYYIVGKLAFGISYLIAWIGGVAITILAWLIGAMLGINQGVFQSTIVQKGFGVTLSIANLGFVLGIIVIAIATILHTETYGYKKILWKLVLAAILVNFSLVIAAPIFGLGNSMAQYFLNCVDPQVGCNAQQGLQVLQSSNDFAANLAGAFNPQAIILGDSAGPINQELPTSVALGQSFGQLLVPVFSVAFVAFELIAIDIVLAGLVVMLFLRYLWIAFLAILMPFAWLGWVFPNIKDWWSKWWSNFIRWTFFAPIVLFFLWLALATSNAMRFGSAIQTQSFGTYYSSSNTIWAPISQLFTNFFTPIIQNVLNIFVMLGLTVGGMVVADRMSITGAKATVGAAQSVGKGVGNFVGKQTKKGGRWALQKADHAVASRSKNNMGIIQRLREGQIGGFKYIPFARRGASYAAQGLTDVERAGGEHLVEQEMKWAKENSKNPIEGAQILAGDLNPQRQIAMLRAMADAKNLDVVKNVNGKKLGDYVADNEQLISHNYGNHDFYDKKLRRVMVNLQTTHEAEAVAAGTPDKEVRDEHGHMVKAIDGLRDSMKNFASKLKVADASEIDANGVFDAKYLAIKENEVRIATFLQKLAAYNVQMGPAIMRNMKGKPQAEFVKRYKQAIEDERKFQNSLNPTDDADKEDKATALKNLDLASKNIDRFLADLARGSGGGPRPEEKKEEPAPAHEPAHAPEPAHEPAAAAAHEETHDAGGGGDHGGH